ncbi:lupus brain antigen [Stylonychia lemnae]|uniref:Lupus brain antigen n=1 Tax=Stylonychia lemnae TaxID=5949 RepID=A0A077ZRJ9_STYLE|nr:lupus brain antigen [Stylonychia lemnae]|eukprot:CDW72543.1 lupus brain antigen [Stylonychia lemnae]
MNLTRYEEIQFTDNLHLAYKMYAKSETVDAQEQTKYLKSRVQLYMDRNNYLRKQFYNQSNVPVDQQAFLENIQQAIGTYFESHNACKALDFDGGNYMKETRTLDFTEEKLLDLLQKSKDDIHQAIKLIGHKAYTEVNFFGDIKSEWDIRLHSQFIAEIKLFSDLDIEVLLFYISLMARGILFLHKYIGKNPKHQNWGIDPSIAYCVIFCEALDEERCIISTINPERIPVCFTEKECVQEFKYRQYILINQISTIEYIRNNRKSYHDTHKVDIRGDNDKFECFNYQNVNFRRDAPVNELQIAVQFKHLFKGDIISYYIRPLKIFRWMLKEPPTHNFLFDKNKRRWYFVNAQQVEIQSKATQVQVQAKVMDELDNKKTTKKLVQILDLMPTLDIKLSKLQKNIVSSNQNLLCLGRSGTGKTTTSVLRLFAQEVLFCVLKKHHEKQIKKKDQEEKRKLAIEQDPSIEAEYKRQDEEKIKQKEPMLDSKDLENDTGIKMVFITASPVLTTEVKRFYGSIKLKLINHLKKREEARAQALLNKEGFQDITEDEALEIIEDSIDEHQKETGKKGPEDHELQEMLQFINKEERDLVDDLSLETHMNIPNSFDNLTSRHFPLFVTVKKLIYMLDACLNYSFFSRDNNNNIIGLDSNLGWHNESKGVLMINHYYKENIDYDEQLAKFGKEILEMDKDAEIDNNFEDQGDNRNFMMINESNQPQSRYVGSLHNRYTEKQYLLERQQLSFEVDYDTFEQKFWPKIITRKNLKKFSPTLVWTEIYSVIKGGMQSGLYYMGYLPRDVYIKEEASEFLYLDEKKAIYYIFLEYEKWKAEQRAYDFMDIVNHIQKRLWYGETVRRMKMDYLMVDEVQDLTPKTLQILLKLTAHNVFFAGDTAQTIAKGVGARFLDLRHIFSSLNVEVPKIVQLATNYRSHGKILDLANSVVSLIELFFPKTIDKLVKEESDKDGMKPLVIMPLDGRQMRNLFAGTSMTSDKDSVLAAPQFGCNQVLIVRDQAAKDLIPDLFKNMLVLSVYEAKGLEFDDVILYNFFHLGDIAKSEWKLLNDIVYQNVKRVKYDAEILDFDCLDVEKFEEIMKKIKQNERNEKDQEYEDDLQLSVSRHRDEVYRKFSMLCIELKFLYVAITRPKRRLIIYDDVADGRKPIQNYWEKLGTIEVVTKDMVAQPETLPENVKDIFLTGALIKERSTQDEWRIQGIKLFKKKYYDAARKCFQNSNDDDLVKRCLAYQEAEIGQTKLAEAENKSWRAKVIKHLAKFDKRRLQKEAKRERIIAKRHFLTAGALFESIDMLKHAASCYFTGRGFNKAGEIFEKLEKYGQAAECYLQVDELKRAARLFERANLITKSIECYESCGEWEQLLHCLHRNKEFFKLEERQSLINKYVPVALNSLYKLYSQEDDDNQLDEENKGKMQEMKIKLKYQKKVDVIAEEDEDDDDAETLDEAEIQEELASKQEDEPKENEEAKEEQIQQEEKDGENNDDEIDLIEDDDAMMPDILDEVFNLKRQKSSMKEEEESKKKREALNKTEQSFEIIDDDEAKNIDEEEEKQQQEGEKEEGKNFNTDDFEHLSQYDPEDEFLRSSKSVSIIESILSRKSISQTSDFSLINGKKVGSVISLGSMASKNTIALIENNRDIYAEDVITQKIIYYVSLFSDEVSSYLTNIRSKKMLHSNPDKQAEKDSKAQEEDFMIDLDEVDQEFVNLILDVLEYYELFRLCLMICNRYHMSERLGRYIISVCSKYSNLHNHRFNLQLLKNSQFNQTWREKQRFASILAHEAIHNVFTLIEPKFLQLKDIDERLSKDNSFGNETYRMMMDLGFWKKIVYTHNAYLGFQICHKFYDRANFEILREAIDLNDQKHQRIKGNIERWNVQLVYAEYQLDFFNTLNLIQIQPEERQVDECFKRNLEQNNPVISSLINLHKWLFVNPKTLEDILSHQKNTKIEAQEKIAAKIQNELDARMEKVYNVLEQYVFKEENNSSFEKYFMAFQLALIPGTQNYSRVLKDIKYYFDGQGVKTLMNIYSQAIDVLNLEKTKADQKVIMEALNQTFLLSSIDDEEAEADESIFKLYKHNYVMMSTQSILAKDILQLQQCMDGIHINEFISQKLVELRPKYFMINNFRGAFIKQYKDFLNQFNQKHAFTFDKNETAFILDMDAKFLMVPKNWTVKLMVIKLLNLCLSLANELKSITNSVEKVESAQDDVINSKIDDFVVEIRQFSKVNYQSLISTKIHNTYASGIENNQKALYRQLSFKEDFKNLLETYWQKTQLGLIKFNSLGQQTQTSSSKSFYFIQNMFYLYFDQGILSKRTQTIVGKSQILDQGFKLFNNIETSQQLNSKQEEKRNSIMRGNLQLLLQALVYFILADSYEILVELIKKEIKSLTKYQHQLAKDTIWLLKKFLIAVDIHVFMKYRSWSNAADSIFTFLQTFQDYLEIEEVVQLIENAFYLVLIGKYSKVYIPDYAIKYLDITYSHLQNYQEYQLANYYQAKEDNEDFVLDLEERTPIKKIAENGIVEKIDQDNLFNQSLQWVNKMINILNKDERSATFKIEYIRLFNILMSAAMNDPKKTTKTIDQLTKGFDELTNSTFDDYFNHYGLLEFDYLNAKGLNDLQKQFKDCEEEYKHQFFAGSMEGGHFLAHVDVSKAQTAENQKTLNSSLNKSIYVEAKTMAAHHYLSYKIKKVLKNKKQEYYLQRLVKQNTFEDRVYSKEIGLQSLLYITQLPGQAVINLMKLLTRKQMMLRQMIISKYVTNSLDIHYVLAKAQELQTQQDNFYAYVTNFLKDKGSILTEFEDLQHDGDNEFEQKISETRKYYQEFENEILTWMNLKSEPNLIEVERKSTKYKLKWEGLKLFEKQERLLAIVRKKQQLLQSQM